MGTLTMTRRQCFVSLLITGIVMSAGNSESRGQTSGRILHGPYFIVDEISDWRIQSGAAQLTLAGGSKWIISEREEKFRLVRDTIDLALRQKKPVFLSE